MNDITIRDQTFSVPVYATYVAVDRSGQVWAYERQPEQETGEGIKRHGWRSPFSHEPIGDLGSIQEDWQAMLYKV